jgi:membrane protease YdiL (CAAX protease family)
VKVFVGAAVTAMFLLVWPWSNNSVAKSLLEAYARTSEELLFRGFLIGELVRLFRNSLRKNMWAAIVSSVVFAGMHSHHGLRLMILRTLPNSAFPGLIAVWTDSILLPIAIHCGTAGGKQPALLGSGIWPALVFYARANDTGDKRKSANPKKNTGTVWNNFSDNEDQ